jgi:hypothetical protein
MLRIPIGDLGVLVEVFENVLEVTYDEALETQFFLQDTIQELAVLASVRVVDSLVRAHQGACSFTQSIHEWPSVQLVQCAVIYIGRDSLAFITGASPVFLFLSKPVLPTSSASVSSQSENTIYLWCSNHTLFLRASGNEASSNSSKIWIRSKAFPVAASSYYSSDRTNERAQSDVDPLAPVLSSESLAISEHKPFVEGCSKMNASRERRYELLASHTSARLTYAWSTDTVREVRLFFQCQLSHEMSSTSICRRPSR